MPETRYASSGDLSIAYQVFGDGPLDIVLAWGGVSHIELFWEWPGFARYFERLAGFARVIQFDRRGTGLSDRMVGVATLEERMDDVRAVMDAVGSERAALIGESEGGPMSVLFAATYPERTVALIEFAPLVRAVSAEDYPWAIAPEDYVEFLDVVRATWGTGVSIDLFAPSLIGDATALAAMARFERYAATPSAFAAVLAQNASIDIRPVLPLVTVPTLVLHRKGDLVVQIEQSRYLAAHVADGTLIELEGTDHLLGSGDVDAVVDEVERFLTGQVGVEEPERVLATVVFTDIVDSTSRASAMGDRAWRAVLDRHDDVTARLITSHRGRLIKSTGDGILATFDGPARAIKCSTAMRDSLHDLGIEIRVGVHTGEVERRGEDIGGIGVHIAARVEAAANAGEILVSRTVTDLVAGSGLVFVDRGEHELKGIPGSWHLCAVDA
jgi:class 3 adenylate cyclase